ncbi:MAG: TRAP transporter large permease subunit [Pseudomonadota bacterium]
MPFDLLLVLLAFGSLWLRVPVGLALGGTSIAFALFGVMMGAFDGALLYAIPARVFGTVSAELLTAIPLFVLMGLVLERSGLVADLIASSVRLSDAGAAKGGVRLQIAVIGVGVLLAASTGIVGASVVTLGLLALAPMIQAGVPAARASGLVVATGTLGQIVPPSIVLIVLGDQLSNAYRTVQLDAGNFAPDSITVSDLFAAGLVPGLILAAAYMAYALVSRHAAATSTADEAENLASALGKQQHANPTEPTLRRTVFSAFVLVALLFSVLGSILFGFAAPSEAASVGLLVALVFTGRRLMKARAIPSLLADGAHLSSAIFFIIVGASVFALVLRGFGGDTRLEGIFEALPGGTLGALFFVMVAVFVLGFFLEFLEICTLVVPLVAPILLAMPMADGSAMNPVWLGILLALNLQTSFLTPPFGVSLFYFRSIAPAGLSDLTLYRGVMPFVFIQLAVLVLVFAVPALATALPNALFGR